MVNGSCSVYRIRSLEGRGERCLKYYDQPGSEDYLALLPLLRLPRGINVPVVLNFTAARDHLMVEEEWIEGCNLRALMIHSPDQVALNAVRWAAQLATTLSRLHEAYGFVHQDLKPENIMIDRFEDVVLIDFDAVRRLRRTCPAYAHHGQASGHLKTPDAIKGTQGYAAPEVALFKGGAAARADLYSFGKMFLEIASLQPHSYSPAFYEIMRRCVRIEATSRIESAAQLRRDLMRLAEEV